MKKGYKELNVRIFRPGGTKVLTATVTGKEVDVEGIRCFQHDDPHIREIKIVSEYTTGIRVGSSYSTYKQAVENARERVRTAGIDVTLGLIKDYQNNADFGIINK